MKWFLQQVFAVCFAAWEFAFAHPVDPCLGRIRLAPQQLGFARGIRVQAWDRHHEGINRDVGHFFKFMLQAFAVRAVRIGENSNFQFAVAAHFFDGLSKGREAKSILFKSAARSSVMLGAC